MADDLATAIVKAAETMESKSKTPAVYATVVRGMTKTMFVRGIKSLQEDEFECFEDILEEAMQLGYTECDEVESDRVKSKFERLNSDYGTPREILLVLKKLY
jgi:hypothetical protein